MKPTIEGRLTALEQATSRRHPVKIGITACETNFTKAELELLRGDDEPCLNPSEIVLVGVDMEEREPRPLEELRRLYAIRKPTGG